METIVLRTAVNSYFWVCLYMVKPLADDGRGRYPKRKGMEPEEIESEEESEEEEYDEETPKPKKLPGADLLKVPSMGIPTASDDDNDSDSEDGESDDDGDSEADDSDGSEGGSELAGSEAGGKSRSIRTASSAATSR